MNDPISVLGVHPQGANKRRPDPRDYAFTSLEVAEASAPFAWQEGNGPDPALVSLLTIKNQGSSGSCGGQAFSYYGQRLRALYATDGNPRSAKFLYSQVYAPGGGSNDRDLANIAIKQGFAMEADTPSYQASFPPTEDFMERPQDITAMARLGAAKDQASFAYAFPALDIETIAQACYACHGIISGLYGENNGTWLTPEPTPPPNASPTSNPDVWSHFMYGAQPQIYNGKKGIWCPQSWGAGAGLNGWQFLDAAYFAANAIWSAVVLVYNPTPVQPPQHVFSANLALGESGADVLALQQYLAYDGEFNLTPTGYYGPITAQAVLRFQIKYGLASIATLDELGGNICGPATRAKLNTLL
jgi:Putative peptidoglycan binding domain